MREIILEKRYPHSREEDITDAFMRGYQQGCEDGYKKKEFDRDGDCFGCKYIGLRYIEGATPRCEGCCRNYADGYVAEQTEPQTDTEIAKAIVHKMIDDAVIAEDAYPDLRQKMHDAVDEYEPQTEEWYTFQDEQEYNARYGKE